MGVGEKLLDGNLHLDVEINEGHETLMLYCSVDAVPMATSFEWQFNGGSLPEGVREQDLVSHTWKYESML